MLLPIFIVSVAFGVLSDATEEPSCEQTRPSHCFSPELDKVRFPDSEEALNRICPILLPSLECMIDFKTKCGINFPGSLDQKLDIFYDGLVEACDKKSKLHQELSTHLPCIDEVHVIQRNTCKPLVKEALEEITSELSLERNEDGDFENREDMIKYHCLYETIDISCFLAITSVRCGEDARDFVGELIDRMGYLDDACPEEQREEAKEAVSLILLQMEVKLATEEILSKV